MSDLADVHDLRCLRDAARLAGALARPLDVVHPTRAAFAPLGAREVLAFAAHPDLCAPLNRALALALGIPDLPVGSAHLARIAQDPRSRLSLLLLAADARTLAQAANLAAAAILHRSAVTIVLKAQRARLGELLGPDLLTVALHEAPVLHGPLGELDPGVVLPLLLESDLEPASAREGLARFGLMALGDFVATVEPDLEPVFARRLPPETRPSNRSRDVTALQATHMVKLMQRRLARWRDYIG